MHTYTHIQKEIRYIYLITNVMMHTCIHCSFESLISISFISLLLYILLYYLIYLFGSTKH
jgi:RsiW-degrading membrane proteinase PrsW (M82 family)